MYDYDFRNRQAKSVTAIGEELEKEASALISYLGKSMGAEAAFKSAQTKLKGMVKKLKLMQKRYEELAKDEDQPVMWSRAVSVAKDVIQKASSVRNFQDAEKAAAAIRNFGKASHTNLKFA